ncbi:MAG: DNA primase [Phycisphaerales bacterium]|nr:MAG: DNA primase [Phycisphaerales bacterium]
MEDFRSIKEKVRQSVSLVEVIAEHVTLRPSGKSLKGRCPFHAEKTPSFFVTPERGIFKCFGCGVGGDVFKFVQLIERVEFMGALRMLAERAGIEARWSGGPRGDRGAGGGRSRADLARVNAWAAGVFARELWTPGQGERARAFLESRGLSRESAERFGLGLAPADGGQLLRASRQASIDPELLTAAGLLALGDGGDRYEVFRDRLMFPIRDTMNRVIGFGGRALGEAKAKYVNTAQNGLFDKGRSLYGLDLARKAIGETRSVLVVEGYTDCMAAHQHGFENTVATLGTALTEAHASLLRRYCDEVTLLFDADSAGEAAADRALGVALQHGLRVTLGQVPEGKDPCDYLQVAGAGGFKCVLNSAVEALGFKWERTLARFQSDSGASDRQAAMADYTRFVAEMGRYGVLDAIQRGLIVNEVARVVSVPAEDVQRLLARRSRIRPGGQRTSEVPTGGHGRGGDREAAGDPEQAASITILEVLLNDPGLWPCARGVFEPGRLRDPLRRAIAERVRGLCERTGGMDVGELLSSIESTQEASCLTDLMFQGESRGDFENTLQSAVSRLEQIRTARAARSAAAELCQPPAGGTQDEGDEALRRWGRLAAEVAGRGQLYPRRAVEDYEAGPEG